MARSARRPVRTGGGAPPSLRVERSLLREGYRMIAAMDEVGRGALAGPASVGIVLVDESVRTAPSGVRDSKLLTPAARQALVPRIRRWAPAYAVGHAGPDEVDAVGILGALRLAARRAMASLPVVPDLVLLDGNHDWFSEPTRAVDESASGVLGLFSLPSAFSVAPAAPTAPAAPILPVVPVRTMVKADLRCSSVAAASVLAKVERDARMVELHDAYPAYCWAENKGYSAPEHHQALLQHGPCEHHRRSWRLPCPPATDVSENDVTSVPERTDGLSRQQEISIMEVMTR